MKPPARQGEAPEQGEQGHTMVYSVPPKDTKSPQAPRRRRPHLTETKAIVSLDDRRYVLDGPVAVARPLARVRLRARDPNVSRRHAELRRGSTGDWQIVDLGSTNGIKVNGRQVDASRLAPGDEVDARHRPRSPSTSSSERAGRVDTEPIAVALKFGFLAVLYLFLLWVARSALQGPAPDRRAGARGDRLPPDRRPGGRAAATDAWLVAVTRRRPRAGERFDLFGGLSIGRSAEADVRIEDRFASGDPRRIYSRGARYYVEDMNSTNGTFLNGGAAARRGGADRPRRGPDRRHRVPLRARGPGDG